MFSRIDSFLSVAVICCCLHVNVIMEFWRLLLMKKTESTQNFINQENISMTISVYQKSHRPAGEAGR